MHKIAEDIARPPLLLVSISLLLSQTHNGQQTYHKAIPLAANDLLAQNRVFVELLRFLHFQSQYEFQSDSVLIH